MSRTSLLFLFLLALATHPVRAQQAPGGDRPTPYPVDLPLGFEEAVEAGTRTLEGTPGPRYWQNTAAYDIDVTLSPATRTVRGTQSVRYTNNAPDTLRRLVVHLRQNIYKEGSVRNTALQVTGGLHLAQASIDGRPLVERDRAGVPGYFVENTLMHITPPEPLAPGETTTLDFAWSYTLRSEGRSPRQGTDGEVFYTAYWYPQLSVYDDVQGWDTDPFRQWSEFYMGYADYDVRITAPEGFLVAATGTLENADEILTPAVRERLAQAARSDEPVHVVAAAERRPGAATRRSPSGALTWRFRAENVRDFAFGASDQYVWDAVRAETGAQDVLVHALYRPEASAWPRAAEFGSFSVEFLSEAVMPYPYPQMTVVEGIVGGGMEYPMITIVGPRHDERRLFGVTLHEIAHVWFPMIVGSQETDYAWMDEGFATYFTRQGASRFWQEDPWSGPSGYFTRAREETEEPVMTHGDRYSSVGTLVVASYDKTSRLLRALEGLYGEGAFGGALQRYAQAWAYRHPYPYDFFHAMEQAFGEDLDWFWEPFFFRTWTLDQAVEAVRASEEGVEVRVADRAKAPAPVLLEVTYADGRTERRRLPVATWLTGARTATAAFPAGRVARVEIDPDGYLPDVDRANNVWTP